MAKFVLAAQQGAEVAKVAVMPRGPQDVLSLLDATYRASQIVDLPLISMSMCGLGAMSRVLGWMYGSAATLAVGRSSSAPCGQGWWALPAALHLRSRGVG